MNETFAMVRRDELWVRGNLREERRGHGEAVARGSEIVARDHIGDAALHAALREACDNQVDRLRRSIGAMPDARIRGVVTCSTGAPACVTAITINVDGVSIVTTPETAAADYAALKAFLGPHPSAPPPTRPVPIVWRNGSAAVLLHEAIGHAAEHGHAPLAWPSWLRVRDVTGDGKQADLLAGEVPVAIRRESFRDLPLRRMTTLVVEQKGAPLELPKERIEVHLIAGGAYEPLTEIVTIEVAVAGRVDGATMGLIPRFTLRCSRAAIAAALLGAEGAPIRYPGVICSREGQELLVGSYAPVMLTGELE